MTIADYSKQLPDELVGALRSTVIASAVAGVVLGIIALVWPAATLLVITILFGFALIFAGVFRLHQAFASSILSTGMRILFGIVGVIIVFAGIITLIRPFEGLVLLGLFIGIGWIFQGVGDLFTVGSGSLHAPKWLVILSGVISVLAGILMVAFPAQLLGTVLWVGAILLIAISIASLFTLPKKVDASAVPAEAPAR